MNQHDEQQGDRQGEVSRAGAEPATADVRVTATMPPEPRDTGNGPLGGTSGVTEPPAAATPPTGDDRVDEALTRLAELDRLDVTEHAGVVEQVHRALQDTLAEEED